MSNDIRRRIWPLILKLENMPNYEYAAMDNKIKLTPKQELQIAKDVDRSLFNFDEYNKLRKKVADEMKLNLKKMIIENISKNGYKYYQGYNDICSVFLLILGPKLAYKATEIISKFFIK